MGALLTTDRYATVIAWVDWHAGVVSRSELAALGIPPTVIASWLRTKRLTRIHRGVYAVGHTAIRAEARWRAAALTRTSSTSRRPRRSAASPSSSASVAPNGTTPHVSRHGGLPARHGGLPATPRGCRRAVWQHQGR